MTAKRAKWLIAKKINKEFIVFDIRKGQVYELNPVAEVVWKYIWKSRHLQELTQKIVEEFDVDKPTAKKDVIFFVNKYENSLFTVNL